MSVILGIQEAEIKKIMVISQLRQIVPSPYLGNTQHKKSRQSGSSVRMPD
jgi:hypothetical protein